MTNLENVFLYYITKPDSARDPKFQVAGGFVGQREFRARHYGAMARDALGLFSDTPLKAALLEAVDFAIARAH